MILCRVVGDCSSIDQPFPTNILQIEDEVEKMDDVFGNDSIIAHLEQPAPHPSDTTAGAEDVRGSLPVFFLYILLCKATTL